MIQAACKCIRGWQIGRNFAGAFRMGVSVRAVELRELDILGGCFGWWRCSVEILHLPLSGRKDDSCVFRMTGAYDGNGLDS